ncbi:MAG TPA: AMP-binding protein, partial [Spirochaetia bacterium]|nr:AMP-binding protein [Spirochaetia bacterium]
MAETLAQLFLEKVRDYPELNAQYSKNGGNEFKPTTYRQLLEEVASFAEALTESGVKRGDRVGLISDNRKEWLITDLALLGLGAADVPRGCDATDQEVRHILSWSECRLTVVENDKQLKRVIDLRAQMPLLEKVIVYESVPEELLAAAKKAKLEVRTYAQAMEEGKKLRAERPGRYEKETAAGKRDETATLIYTSGTTGEPKGVMLTHGNFLYQTDYILTII